MLERSGCGLKIQRNGRKRCHVSHGGPALVQGLYQRLYFIKSLGLPLCACVSQPLPHVLVQPGKILAERAADVVIERTSNSPSAANALATAWQ